MCCSHGSAAELHPTVCVMLVRLVSREDCLRIPGDRLRVILQLPLPTSHYIYVHCNWILSLSLSSASQYIKVLREFCWQLDWEFNWELDGEFECEFNWKVDGEFQSSIVEQQSSLRIIIEYSSIRLKDVVRRCNCFCTFCQLLQDKVNVNEEFVCVVFSS